MQEAAELRGKFRHSLQLLKAYQERIGHNAEPPPAAESIAEPPGAGAADEVISTLPAPPLDQPQGREARPPNAAGTSERAEQLAPAAPPLVAPAPAAPPPSSCAPPPAAPPVPPSSAAPPHTSASATPPPATSAGPFEQRQLWQCGPVPASRAEASHGGATPLPQPPSSLPEPAPSRAPLPARRRGAQPPPPPLRAVGPRGGGEEGREEGQPLADLPRRAPPPAPTAGGAVGLRAGAGLWGAGAERARNGGDCPPPDRGAPTGRGAPPAEVRAAAAAAGAIEAERAAAAAAALACPAPRLASRRPASRPGRGRLEGAHVVSGCAAADAAKLVDLISDLELDCGGARGAGYQRAALAPLNLTALSSRAITPQRLRLPQPHQLLPPPRLPPPRRKLR